MPSRPSFQPFRSLPSSFRLVGWALLVGCLFLPSGSRAQEPFRESEIFGHVGAESRLFFQQPLAPDQPRTHSLSLFGRAEWEAVLRRGLEARVLVFGRWDESDSRRTHADLREAFVRVGSGAWVVEAGMNVVFWGVTESRHLVDVVNQTDYLEDLDGDEKLGQLMARLSYDDLSWGLFEAYLMGGSRQQRFPGVEGRPGLPIPVRYDRATYEAGAGRWDPDVAFRWSHAVEAVDVGVSLFRGTGREPEILPRIVDGDPVLRPSYALVHQAGVDVQWTGQNWLWKGEGIYRDGPRSAFFATTFGFERTFWSAWGSSTDLGILLEYSHDGRDDLTFTVHDDDVFGGLRLTLNDVRGTEILAGALTDVDTGATFASVEASRRLGRGFALDLTARLFVGGDENEPLYWFRRDDYLESVVVYYF